MNNNGKIHHLDFLIKILRLLLTLILKIFYRFQVYNSEILKTDGPVLLVSNHVSWLDWLLIGVLLDEDWKFVTSSTTSKLSPLHRFIMVNRRTFTIDPLSPYSAKKMAEYLKKGGRLVLFPEGRISFTGNLSKLYEGVGFLLHSTSTKIILCRISGAERTIWAKQTGWKRIFFPVLLHFKGPFNHPKIEGRNNSVIRTRLTRWLADLMAKHQFEVNMQFSPSDIPSAIMEIARRIPNFKIIEDIQQKPLTYRNFCLAVNLLYKQLNFQNSNNRIGVLLPNINATAVLIAALWKANKIPAILNYSSGIGVMIKCAKIAELKHIITSRAFLERTRIDVNKFISAGFDVVYLEDYADKISSVTKILHFLASLLADPNIKPNVDSLANKAAVVLFTSGSEGEPKGVELSHLNILSNIHQLSSVIDMTDRDRFFSSLPFFHSFGLTAGMFFPLVRGIYSFFYLSPLHYKHVPLLFYEKHCTIMFSTNTFLNGYIRRAHQYDFHTARLLYAGAEKVQSSTAENFGKNFGVRILEGYGATECSPVISVNTPIINKFGTAGRFLPGIEWKLIPVEGIDTPNAGRLLLKGPNIMMGYINPDANAMFAALGGWYDTGDIVCVDEDGFIEILGRVKRFAKISGEMVSINALEETLSQILQPGNQRLQIAIVNVPDSLKGERLIAVTNDKDLTIIKIQNHLKNSGFSTLVYPSELIYLEEIPKLGSGKINYPELKAIIEQKTTK